MPSYLANKQTEKKKNSLAMKKNWFFNLSPAAESEQG